MGSFFARLRLLYRDLGCTRQCLASLNTQLAFCEFEAVLFECEDLVNAFTILRGKSAR